MTKKEYYVDDLLKDARLVWELVDEPEPDVRVFVKDRKAGIFITVTSGYMGCPTGKCYAIGEPFSYDEAYVLSFDPRSTCCRPALSCFFALGQKGRATVYVVEAYEARPLIENAASMEDAMNQFGERIGVKYAPWVDLLVPPPPTWVKIDYTPEKITSLEPHQIFVFGSNLEGRHAGGAARVAFEYFGAIWGQGEGLHGQSYALPTMGLSIDEIKAHIDILARCASEHPELEFLVTKVGCGIAGFKEREIAPLFYDAYMGSKNITLPESFVDILRVGECADCL